MGYSRHVGFFRLGLSVFCCLASAGCSAEPGGAGASGSPTVDPSATPTTPPTNLPGSGGTSGIPTDPPAIDGNKPLTCDPAQTSLGPQRIWRLTREQMDLTLSGLLGTSTHLATDRLPKEFSTNGFLNNSAALRVREPEVTQQNAIAKELAADTVSARLATLFPCPESQLADATCQQDFVKSFGEKAFRRPLQPEELTRYQALFALGLAKKDAKLGITAVVEAMLQSPYFWFRTEIGVANGAKARLDNFELASALSYALTNTAPDAELQSAARAGELTTDANVVVQVRRLLGSALARPALGGFLRQLFSYPFLEDANKNPQLFPNFATLKPLMQSEADQFFPYVLFDDGGKLETLLTANYTFANSELAQLYGVSAPGSAFTKVMLPANQRAGALGLSGVMSTLAVDNRTSPVARGMFIRERLLCATIPDPPAGVDLTIPELPPGLTARQQLEARTTAPACSACHSLMNPLGFGLEKLDSIGRFRDTENSLPIDDSGEFKDTADLNGTFQGAVDLAQKLSTSDQVRQCLTLDTFRYALGRAESLGDACALTKQKAAFAAANYDIKELWVATLSSEPFLYRAVGQ
ncbi:MAG: DUF1592 domain-containing protein [Polyangiaceae bacterium]|nr:DUF1592 domain-containing protein [Polyangiaceae bacterium]